MKRQTVCILVAFAIAGFLQYKALRPGYVMDDKLGVSTSSKTQPNYTAVKLADCYTDSTSIKPNSVICISDGEPLFKSHNPSLRLDWLRMCGDKGDCTMWMRDEPNVIYRSGDGIYDDPGPIGPVVRFLSLDDVEPVHGQKVPHK